MLLIPTYLARSSIHGIGVFTPFPIPKGTRLWEFTPGVDWRLTAKELLQIPEPHQAKLRTYCYLNGNGLYVLCGDNARYMNHAEEPNCDDWGDQYTVARRDIAANEELTCDYRTFDAESAALGDELYQPQPAENPKAEARNPKSEALSKP